MIQDIAPHVLYNQYRHFTPSENDPVFCFYDEKVLIRLEDDQLTFPKVKDLDVNQEDLIYLFSLDSSHLFLYLKQTEREGCEYIDFRTIRRKSLRPKEQFTHCSLHIILPDGISTAHIADAADTKPSTVKMSAPWYALVAATSSIRESIRP